MSGKALLRPHASVAISPHRRDTIFFQRLREFPRHRVRIERRAAFECVIDDGLLAFSVSDRQRHAVRRATRGIDKAPVTQAAQWRTHRHAAETQASIASRETKTSRSPRNSAPYSGSPPPGLLLWRGRQPAGGDGIHGPARRLRNEDQGVTGWAEVALERRIQLASLSVRAANANQ